MSIFKQQIYKKFRVFTATFSFTGSLVMFFMMCGVAPSFADEPAELRKLSFIQGPPPVEARVCLYADGREETKPVQQDNTRQADTPCPENVQSFLVYKIESVTGAATPRAKDEPE